MGIASVAIPRMSPQSARKTPYFGFPQKNSLVNLIDATAEKLVQHFFIQDKQNASMGERKSVESLKGNRFLNAHALAHPSIGCSGYSFGVVEFVSEL